MHQELRAADQRTAAVAAQPLLNRTAEGPRGAEDGGDQPGRLLPPVLEGVEPEEDELRRVAGARNADQSALVVRTVIQRCR